MFTLEELQLIFATMDSKQVSFPFQYAHILAPLRVKLIDSIAEKEAVENRQKAAMALKVVSESAA
jgi:hypothetical protein